MGRLLPAGGRPTDVVVAGVSAILLGAAVAATEPAVHTVLLGLIVLALLLPIILRRARGEQFDILEPHAFFIVATAVFIVVRCALVAATGEFGWAGFDTSRGLVPALGLSLIGVVSWALGYELRGPRRVAQRVSRRLIDPGPFACAVAVVVLAALAVLGQFIFLYQAGLPISWLWIGREAIAVYREGVGYFYSAPLLMVPALALGVSLWQQRLRWPLVVAAVATAPLLVSAFFKGGRFVLAGVLLTIGVFVYLSRQRRPSLLTIGVVIALAVIPASVLRDTRLADQPVSRTAAATETLRNPGDALQDAFLGPDAEAGQGLMFLVDWVPRNQDFQPGSLPLSILASPIPRAVWPEKPLIPEHQIMATVFPDQYQRDPAGRTFSAFGSFYFDSGLIGVVVGMFAAGWVFRFLWEWGQRSGTVPALIFLATLPTLVIAFVRASAPPALMYFLFMSVPMLILGTRWAASIARERKLGG